MTSWRRRDAHQDVPSYFICPVRSTGKDAGIHDPRLPIGGDRREESGDLDEGSIGRRPVRGDTRQHDPRAHVVRLLADDAQDDPLSLRTIASIDRDLGSQQIDLGVRIEQ